MKLLSLVYILLNFASILAFPTGKCTNKNCSSTPLKLTWVDIEQDNKFCFITKSMNCRSNDNTCLSFDDYINKIVLTVNTSCINNIKNVTIDGVKKGGGVYPYEYNYTSELHITNLQWNKQTANNHLICIYTEGDNCNNLIKWCSINCRYSIYNALNHLYCPTCQFNIDIINDRNITIPDRDFASL